MYVKQHIHLSLLLTGFALRALEVSASTSCIHPDTVFRSATSNVIKCYGAFTLKLDWPRARAACKLWVDTCSQSMQVTKITGYRRYYCQVPTSMDKLGWDCIATRHFTGTATRKRMSQTTLFCPIHRQINLIRFIVLTSHPAHRTKAPGIAETACKTVHTFAKNHSHRNQPLFAIPPVQLLRAQEKI